MHPKDISIADYTYLLPEERIAAHPLAERDASRLLIYKNGNITKDVYKNISAHIPHGAFMVFNDTRVVEARLLFQKETGGTIEIFCLEPHESYPDITTAMSAEGSVLWLCLVGGASKWKRGLVLEKELFVNNKKVVLQARYIEKRADCFVIELSWNDGLLSFSEVLHQAGQVPLPPYMKRPAEQEDAVRYQTVYAHYDGSVAAPTAGLHFTNEVLDSLRKKSIHTSFVTLHVGAGTFKPVKSQTMQDHEMHSEFIEVTRSFIETLLANLESGVVAVGTTSLRTIESLYWFGCKLLSGGDEVYKGRIPFLSQWEAYDLEDGKYPVSDSLKALLAFLERSSRTSFMAKTQIIIAPGYQFKIANGLVTNFHQPSSTLLLLVAAFIGDDWRKVYQYALHNQFRFLSYGDGSLLWHL